MSLRAQGGKGLGSAPTSAAHWLRHPYRGHLCPEGLQTPDLQRPSFLDVGSWRWGSLCHWVIFSSSRIVQTTGGFGKRPEHRGLFWKPSPWQGAAQIEALVEQAHASSLCEPSRPFFLLCCSCELSPCVSSKAAAAAGQVARVCLPLTTTLFCAEDGWKGCDKLLLYAQPSLPHCGGQIRE